MTADTTYMDMPFDDDKIERIDYTTNPHILKIYTKNGKVWSIYKRNDKFKISKKVVIK